MFPVDRRNNKTNVGPTASSAMDTLSKAVNGIMYFKATHMDLLHDNPDLSEFLDNMSDDISHVNSDVRYISDAINNNHVMSQENMNALNQLSQSHKDKTGVASKKLQYTSAQMNVMNPNNIKSIIDMGFVKNMKSNAVRKFLSDNVNPVTMSPSGGKTRQRSGPIKYLPELEEKISGAYVSYALTFDEFMVNNKPDKSKAYESVDNQDIRDVQVNNVGDNTIDHITQEERDAKRVSTSFDSFGESEFSSFTDDENEFEF